MAHAEWTEQTELDDEINVASSKTDLAGGAARKNDKQRESPCKMHQVCFLLRQQTL
jgi:hypothetical protein